MIMYVGLSSFLLLSLSFKFYVVLCREKPSNTTKEKKKYKSLFMFAVSHHVYMNVSSHASGMALAMTLSVCVSAHHMKTSQQLLNGLPRNVAQTLIIPRGWILVTLVTRVFMYINISNCTWCICTKCGTNIQGILWLRCSPSSTLMRLSFVVVFCFFLLKHADVSI